MAHKSNYEFDSTKSKVSSSCTETNLETPDSCIVTPYKTSASSIVPLRWVITINCVSELCNFTYFAKRITFASSKAASTSSRTQNGTGLTRKIENSKEMAVNALSPPDNNPNCCSFFPGG